MRLWDDEDDGGGGGGDTNDGAAAADGRVKGDKWTMMVWCVLVMTMIRMTAMMMTRTGVSVEVPRKMMTMICETMAAVDAEDEEGAEKWGKGADKDNDEDQHPPPSHQVDEREDAESSEEASWSPAAIRVHSTPKNNFRYAVKIRT